MKVLLVPVLVAGGAALFAYWILPWCLPWPESLDHPVEASPAFEDRQGQPLRRLLDEGEGYGRGLERVAFEGLPADLVAATVSVEDQRYFRHGGIDCLAVLRAAIDGLRRGKIVSGASTITQQLVKISSDYPDARRTWARKLREMLLARRVEMRWDKERILVAYLNRIDYGNGHRGCAAAAQGYFQKPLSDLSLAESAFLAGLPQAPGRLNPYRHLDRAEARQQQVLRRLEEDEGEAMGERVRRARNEGLTIAPRAALFEAPHFVEHLLALEVPPQRTTLDLDCQRQVETLLRSHLETLGDPRLQGAVVVLENESSGVRAWVGSRDFSNPHGGQVDGVLATRSPGSALKPFTYALGLERGYTPVSILADVPTEYQTPTGLYQPENYHRHHLGPVSYREALGNSLNVPAVRLLQDLGGSGVLLEALRDLGLSTLTESEDHYGLGLTIGNAPVRLIELATAYSSLARGGLARPYRILAAKKANGDEKVSPSERCVFRAETAFLITDILGDDRARWREFGRRSEMSLPYSGACKTGTSSAYRDAWAFGYTPTFTVGVWVGRMDGRPMDQISSVRGAAPVLRKVLDWLHLKDAFEPEDFVRPDGVLPVWVDRRTGKALEADALKRRHQRLQQAALQTWCASWARPESSTPNDYDARGRVRLDGRFVDWLKGEGASWQDRYILAATTADEAVRITFPIPGTVIYLDPALPDGGRRLSLKATSSEGVLWHSSTLSLRQEDDGRAEAWLSPGRHEIRVENGEGNGASTWVTVKSL